MGFVNPYNFIPSLPRKKGGPLGDSAPCGHDAYLPDRWSGTIQVTLRAESPLLLPDASRVEAHTVGRDRNHFTFDTRTDPITGRPVLAPTSIKGMLRSAYEAVTNSRFSIFGAHDDRLPYRMGAREGIRMIPAIVTPTGLDLLMGSTPTLPYPTAKGWRVDGTLYAAWLERYQVNTSGPKPGSLGAGLTHGQQVWFHARRVNKPHYAYWSVVDVASSKAALPVPPAAQAGEFIEASGRVFVSNQNIKNKHHERIFFEHAPGSRVSIALSGDERKRIEDEWTRLISGARDHRHEEIHERVDKKTGKTALPDKYLGSDPGDTAWSRHMHVAGAEKLAADTLCYVAIRPDADVGRLTAADIDGITPVQIARRLFDAAPSDMLSGRRKPAVALDELSPADRVFGWTNQQGKGAHRGQLRITESSCLTAEPQALTRFAPVPLAILGGPKPQQGRFYAAEDDRGTPIAQGSQRAALYRTKDPGSGKQTNHGLRGRKVYLHQRVPSGYWQPDAPPGEAPGYPWTVREFLRQGPPAERADSQNRSITSWVAPHTDFSIRMDVVNLSREELGALLWLLTRDEDQFFKIGGGKPLGFGSVHLRLAGVDLANGDYQRAQYRHLGPQDPPIGPGDAAQRISGTDGDSVRPLVEAFESAVAAAYGDSGRPPADRFRNVPFIKAFLRAAVGVSGPVHYPRAGAVPDPEGKNYAWFVANEDDKDDRQRSLPALDQDGDLKLPFF